MILDVPIKGAATLYNQTGDLFTWLCQATTLHSGSVRPGSHRPSPAVVWRDPSALALTVEKHCMHYGINAFWRSVQTTPSRLKASRITPRGRQSEKISSARPSSLPSQSRQSRRSFGQERLSIRKLARRFNRDHQAGRLWARPIGRRFRSSCPFDAGNGRPRRRRGYSTGVGRGQWEASNANDLSTSSTVCTRQ